MKYIAMCGRKVITRLWAANVSGKIHEKLVADVPSGERNWKPEARGSRDPCSSWSTFFLPKFRTIWLYSLLIKEKEGLLCLPRQQLFPQGYFWQDVLVKGVGRHLFSCPGQWNPCFPLSWQTTAQSRGLHWGLPTQMRNFPLSTITCLTQLKPTGTQEEGRAFLTARLGLIYWNSTLRHPVPSPERVTKG